jgi:hypothetical protein
VNTERPADEHAIRLLGRRDGEPTTVVLPGGTRCIVHNIAWGYDIGERYAHVTTNISPGVEGAEVDFFETRNVASILDEHGWTLLELDPLGE